VCELELHKGRQRTELGEKVLLLTFRSGQVVFGSLEHCTGVAEGCGMLALRNPRGRGVLYKDVTKFFPVPLFEAGEFPELEGLLESSMEAFRHLQHQFRRGRVQLGQSGGAFVIS